MIGSQRLPDVIVSRDGAQNNFDIIRLTAALLVLFSHAFPLSGDTSLIEPFALATKGQAPGGHIAVQVFFFLSGFLVMRSLERRSSLVSFTLARIFRILPGLFVAVCFGAIIVGPLFSTLSASAYFDHPLFWRYFNSALLDVQYVLPGVFENHPDAAMNGSLWSLEIEAIMYLCLPLILLAPSRMRKHVALAVLITFLVWVEIIGLNVQDGFHTYYIVVLGQFFAAGATAYLWRDTIVLNNLVALICAICIVATARYGQFFNAASVLAGGYLLLWITYCMPKIAAWISRIGDLSYGVYIYAFPVQQIVFHSFDIGGTWWGNALLSVPGTLLLAYLSWTFVEKPAMRLRKPVSSSVEKASQTLLRSFSR